MNRDFNRCFRSVRDWLVDAQSTGWLDAGDAQALDEIETATAQDFFEGNERRPLLVGLFGGTGVGKSSLLNRLAGEPIARVGVERPTSRRATIYLHESQPVTGFPQDSPINFTDIRYHSRNDRRDVAWLDMPDMDSVEPKNRELALAWLPYIDWLIYVVSPERYRDDSGWQVLQQRQHRHHWLFVVNHWDEAKDMQLEEFARDLKTAGFVEPILLRTSCEGPNSYDFQQLESTVDKAIEEHGLAELQRVGALARLQQLNELSQQYLARMGDPDRWHDLLAEVTQVLSARLEIFRQRMESEISGFVSHYPGAPALWQGDRKLPLELNLEKEMWSSYFDSLLDNIDLDATDVIDKQGIASAPLSRLIRKKLASARGNVLSEMRDGLDQALNEPGTPVQTVLRRLTGFMAFALPLAGGIWVAYNVVTQYQQGLAGEENFFGFNFALHSLLLIGLAWFIPFLLCRWLRPSVRASARRGLRYGLSKATKALQQDLMASLNEVERERERLLAAFPDSTGQGSVRPDTRRLRESPIS